MREQGDSGEQGKCERGVSYLGVLQGRITIPFQRRNIERKYVVIKKTGIVLPSS